MRQHSNGPVAKTLGWFYYTVVAAAALAAIPLYVLTSGGQG
jgi:hypothetical protein